MVLPQALEYNWEFNRSLEQIGETARQRAMQQRKLEQDNQEKIFQVYQSVGPAALYPKYNKLVVNQRIGETVQRLKDYQKQNPNASYIELQGVANMSVGEIAQQSAGIEALDKDIDKWISSMDQKSPYDKSRLRALARNEAFYEEDGTTLRSNFDGLNVDNIISKVIEKNEDKLIDPFKGEQAMNDVVKDAALYTKNVEQTVETPDGRKTVIVGQKSSVPFFLEAKDGELRVKQQPNGYIDENVFQQIYQNPAIRANINANAKANMKKTGVEDTPENFEYFKRAYLTTWLESNKKGAIEKVDKTLYQKPSGGSFGSKSEKKSNDTTDYIQRVMDVATNGTAQDLADVLYEMKAGNGKYTVKKASVSNKNKGIVIEYETGTYDEDGNPVISKETLNPNSSTFAIDLASFYQKATGSDAKLEKSILTGKKKYTKKTTKYIIDGKEYSMDDLTKLGYTKDQVDQAIKSGKVKTK